MQRGRPRRQRPHSEVKASCKHSKVLHRKTPESTPQRKTGRRLSRTRRTCKSCVMVRTKWCQEPGNPDYAQHHVVKTSSSRNQLAPQHTSAGRQLCVALQMISPGSAFSPALGKMPIIMGRVTNLWQIQMSIGTCIAPQTDSPGSAFRPAVGKMQTNNRGVSSHHANCAQQAAAALVFALAAEERGKAPMHT